MLCIDGKESIWWVVGLKGGSFTFDRELHTFRHHAERKIKEIRNEAPDINAKLEPVAVKVCISPCSENEAKEFHAEQQEFLAQRRNGRSDLSKATQ